LADPRVDEFVEAARLFCEAVEDARPPAERLAGTLASALVDAYARALELPHVAATSDEIPEDARQSSSDVQGTLESAFGDADAFRTVFDPTEDDDAYTSSLAQELYEIYEDLIEGRAWVARYGATDDCLWQLRWSFRNHWGDHAMHVLPALHWLCRYE
jgi:hypothetical protein